MLFKNARIVLEDEVIEGTARIEGETIAEIASGPLAATGPDILDLEGDFLIPGLIELHTDHLEGHYAPRPRVRWDPSAAALAHDAQIASAGVSTVFDALRAGSAGDGGLGVEDMSALGGAVVAMAPHLRAEHFVHLRCEVSAGNCAEDFERLSACAPARIVSLMDHAPGQRQFADTDAYAAYYRGKLGMSESEFAAFFERRVAESRANAGANRAAIARRARAIDAVLASHDDATEAHIDEALSLGVVLSEFPTTMRAARAAKDAGLAVLMGAPNLMRGGSHSGNVAARELAEADCLDILSSDYIPYSLLRGAFALPAMIDGLELPAAIAKVASNPARVAGLADRGRIAPGLRADLAVIHAEGALPVLRSLWRQGRRVA